MRSEQEIREDEINSINYFVFEKGDLNRWTSWEDVKHKYPEIVVALKDVEKAQKYFYMLVKSLE